MKKSIATSGKAVTFTFDGGLEPVSIDVSKISAANREYAVCFGLGHRIGDHAALSRNGPGGAIITITEDMRRNAVLEMVAHLESGTGSWDMAKGARGPIQHPVFLEIAKRNNISYDEAVAKVQADNLRDFAAA